VVDLGTFGRSDRRERAFYCCCIGFCVLFLQKGPIRYQPEPVFEEPRKMTEQEKHRHTFYFLRKVPRDQKLIHIRHKRNKKREEKAAKEKESK